MESSEVGREDEGGEGADPGCQPCEDDAPTGARMAISDGVMASFGAHVDHLTNARLARKEQLRPKSVVETVIQAQESGEVQTAASSSTALVPVITAEGNLDAGSVWKRLESDQFEGDAVLRCLNSLLELVDDRGYQRSAHQLRFHASFLKATARVVYKNEWQANKPKIMERNGWDKAPSEVLISTPRRFGKTFSIAIFVACLALSCGCEIVVFSPARRASRKLLERIVEFIRLVDCGNRIREYNQASSPICS